MGKNLQNRTAPNGAAGAARAGSKSNAKSNQQQQKPQQQQKKEVVVSLPSTNDVPSLSLLFPEVSDTIAQNAPQIRTVAKAPSSQSQPKANSSNQAKNQLSSAQPSKNSVRAANSSAAHKNAGSKSVGDWSSNLTGLSLLYPEIAINTSDHQLRIVSSKQNQKPVVNASDRQVRVVASKQNQNSKPQKQAGKAKQEKDWSSNLINLAELFPDVAISASSNQVRVVASSQAQNTSQQAKLPRAQKLVQLSKGTKKNASDWSANLLGLDGSFPEVQVNGQSKQVPVIANKQNGSMIQQDLQSSGLQKVSTNQAIQSQLNAKGGNQRNLNAVNSGRGNSVQKLSGTTARAESTNDRDRELEEISWLFPEQFSRLPEVSRKQGASLLQSQQKLNTDDRNHQSHASKDSEHPDSVTFENGSQNLGSRGSWSKSQSRDWAGRQQTNGPINWQLKGLGMSDAKSNFSSMSSSNGQGSSGWSWNYGAKSRVGSGSGHPDYYGLLAALNSIIIVSNSRGAYSGENNPEVARKGPSISEFHRGTYGHFFSVDCARSATNSSAILAGAWLNSRVRYPDSLEEAIRWRKHIFDRG